MEIYEVVSMEEGDGRCLLRDNERGWDMEVPSLSEAAVQAQTRAEGKPAVLRVLNPDNTLRSERTIPTCTQCSTFGASVGASWGWF